MVKMPRYLSSSSGVLTYESLSSGSPDRPILKLFWNSDGNESQASACASASAKITTASKGVYVYFESVRAISAGFDLTLKAYFKNPNVNHVLILYVADEPLNRREFIDPEKSIQVAKRVKGVMQMQGVIGYMGLFMLSGCFFKLQANPFDMNDFTEVAIESAGPSFVKALLRI